MAASDSPVLKAHRVTVEEAIQKLRQSEHEPVLTDAACREYRALLRLYHFAC